MSNNKSKVKGNDKLSHVNISSVPELQSTNLLMANEKNKYLTIFESLHIPIILLDIENKIININHKAEELFSEKPIPGCIYYEQSQGKQTLPWLNEEINSFILSNTREQTFNKQFDTQKGSRYFNIILKRMLDVSEKFCGTVVIFDDITEKKYAEEESMRLATAIYQSEECIIITDNKGNIQYLNPAFERITGYRYEEVIGKNPGLVKSGKHDEPFYKDIWDTITGGKVWRGHFINKKKDGTLYEEEASISPIRDITGNITNYVAVKRDVTQEIKLKNQLRHAQKIEAIGTLAGGIAHDFNNILSGLMGYAELTLLEDHNITVIHTYVNRILKGCNRAKDLVKQILTFSRQSEQTKEVLEISSIIREAIKLPRATLPSTIEIRENIENNAGIILADAIQIHQIIVNLCTNAAHAMRDKGGILEISLSNIDIDTENLYAYQTITPGSYVRLSVSDTGHGMDSTVKERIFDPYFTTKKHGEGTGLGLSVVHGIVKSHDGEIKVYSEPGKGTIFHIYLPIIKTDLTNQIDKEETIATGNETILLVDDELDIVKIRQIMLEKLGYNVIATTSSMEALESFCKEPDKFDLIITDHTMPGMTGSELGKKILKIKPDMPVILCSGFSEIIDEDKARNIGFKEFIIKPITIREMAKIIRKVLRGCREITPCASS
jgi:PAS domain S-box-containing protein